MQVSRLRQMRGLSVRCVPRGFSTVPNFSMTDHPPGWPMMEAPLMALAATICRATAVSIVSELMRPPLVRRRLSRKPRINIKWFDADLLINITRDRDNSEEENHDTHADAGVSLSCVSVRWWESRISRRNKKATSRIALVRG